MTDKKRLGICVNHSAPFHTGGSEKVVQLISESMVKDFDMDCHVITRYANSNSIINNGVHIHKSKNTSRDFIDQINNLNLDHLFVYSDSFDKWPIILSNIDNLSVRNKSIALVGMNHMLKHSSTYNLFKNRYKDFSVITHSSNYLDYNECKNNNIPINVINNGVDLGEFKLIKNDFRDKYDIKTKYILLCVSNFFPGKGQEHLLTILNNLHKNVNDFTAVFVSTDVNFIPAQNLRKRFFAQLNNMAKFKFKNLINISREDTISSFLSSDVFIFPTQKEVAPLVVLESMACGLPWVSLDVGNVADLLGGISIKAENDLNGYKKYNYQIYEKFTNAISMLLSSSDLRSKISQEGRNQIYSDYNWDKIKYEYYNLFTNN